MISEVASIHVPFCSFTVMNLANVSEAIIVLLDFDCLYEFASLGRKFPQEHRVQSSPTADVKMKVYLVRVVLQNL